MSYHDTNYSTPSSAKQSTTNAQGQIAPTGYHFMPDGTLMSDAEHYRLYAVEKTIFGIDIDFKDIKEAGETRRFTVTGDNDAVFSLEMTNEDSPQKYYNFQTHAFQTTRTRLSNKTIEEGSYTGIIKFPVVTDADQYNFHLFAESDYNTKHDNYVVATFPDGTVDINSSNGSNSNLVQKVIYQTLDTAITLSNLSPTGGITSISNTTQVIAASRSKNVIKTPFEIKATFSSGAISIDRQPTNQDITALIAKTIGSAPVNIPGEDIYPAITTAADSTSEGGTTVNGSSTGTTVTTHVVSSTIAAVGDRVLGNAALAAAIVTVTAVSGGSGKTFTISESISIADDLPLTFSNRRNYRWSIDNIDRLQIGMRTIPSTFFATTPTIKDYVDQITVFEGEANEYKIDNVIVPALDTLGAKPSIVRSASTNVVRTIQTGNIVFSEQALLSFANATPNIYAYGVDEINDLTGYDVEFSDLRVAINKISTTTTAAVSSSTTIPITSKVGITEKTTQTVNGATRDSKIVVLDSVDGLGIGQSLYAVSAGTLVETPTIATINETTKAITLTVAQTFADGITLTFPNSIISGIGIASGAIDPYVVSISSLNLTASAAQTLEDAQTFTFTGAGNVATITGNITVNNVGNNDVTLYFDLDKFLTQHSN